MPYTEIRYSPLHYLLLVIPEAHGHHEVAQRSVKLMWITGSNCCQMPLCAFYHLRIVHMKK